MATVIDTEVTGNVTRVWVGGEHGEEDAVQAAEDHMGERSDDSIYWSEGDVYEVQFVA